MTRVLLVDDDAEQTSIRKLIFERAGHDVMTANDCESARAAFTRSAPQVVVMDLRIPNEGDGLALIREFRLAHPEVRIVVLSGYAYDLSGAPEATMIDTVMTKPARSERLLSLVSKLAVCILLLVPLMARAAEIRVDRAGEVVAQVSMSAPGCNWGRPGREAAMADIAVDGRLPFQVMLYAGEERRSYPVFLGRLQAGEHRVTISRNERYSAPPCSISEPRIENVRVDNDPVIAYAPVLSARENTIGKFTDLPMIVYAERIRENGVNLLQYTVIFTNEDGGTSTRALMARWGRTTDIEYVYKVDPATNRATIQARGHKEEEFHGEREDMHPLLMPVTDNNMVSGGESAIRYRIAPRLVDLTAHSREQVMDEDPVTYRVMAEELEREDKLRPFGVINGEKISDTRNYIYIEALVKNRNAALAVHVRLKGEGLWRSSDLGRLDYAIARDGWIRTTVELPPGTKPNRISEIGLACAVAPPQDRKWALTGACDVERISKIFLLDGTYRPQRPLWSLSDAIEIPAGEMRTWKLEPASSRE
jgi:CheY-like chemotaxis protein